MGSDNGASCEHQRARRRQHLREGPAQRSRMSVRGRPPDEPNVALTQGQVNAVRATFKAGITPSRIAKQFGISPSDVRKVLASEFRGSGRGR